MALETGASAPGLMTDSAVAANDVEDMDLPPPGPTVEGLAFAPGAPLGAGLRNAREFLGMSLQDVADITKIRKQYLALLEDMEVAKLPSRPFAIGYVRAYARILGVDEDTAILRFKQDAPEHDEGLRAPVGVARESDPRFVLIGVAGAIVIAAIVIWNIAQRAMNEQNPQSTAAVSAPPLTVAEVTGAPVALGEALPPPVEATIPAPYTTPGMDGAVPPPAPSGTQVVTAPRVQGMRGRVLGAPANQSIVTLQAARNVIIVVKESSGKVVFIQPLNAGDTYRAPMTPGLLIDVDVPSALDVFVRGEFRGALTAAITPLSSLMK